MSDSRTTAIDDKVIFVCEKRPFTGRDVIDAAHFRGELAAPWRNLLRLLAAERRADESNLEFSDEAIESAVEQFRYAHDLITAEETEQWLATRALSLDDFSNYFTRRYWGAKLEEEVSADETQLFECCIHPWMRTVVHTH